MKSLREILSLFLYSGWRRQSLIIATVLVGVIAENLSIASLWPIIGITSGTEANPSSAARTVTQLFELVNLSPSLGALLLFMCLAMTVKFLLGSAAAIYVGREVARTSTQMRVRLLEAIVQARWSHIIDTPAGRLLSAIGSESDRASSAHRSACMFAARLTETVAYLAGTLWISWQLSLAAISAAAILWISVAPFTAAARRAGRSKWKSNHLLTSGIGDLLTAMKSLRAMNQQSYLQRFIGKQMKDLRKASEREFHNEAAARAMQEPLLATLLIGGFYVGHTYMNLGLVELIGTIWLLRRISTSVSGMRGAIQRVGIDGIAFRSVVDLTQDMIKNAEILHGGSTAYLTSACEFDNVSFAHREKSVVKAAKFALPTGELCTLIGPSGAGKTTIADLLVGLHEPSSGRVLVDQLPLSEVNLAEWRRMIGYVPQDNIMYDDTILENVTLGDGSIGEDRVIRALKLAGAWTFVSQLPNGLREHIGVRGNLLSGGQKQRLSIARALVNDPQILILDEATSALDQTTAREICEAVKGLRENRVVLAITHQSIWASAADRTYRMENGYVTSEGKSLDDDRAALSETRP